MLSLLAVLACTEAPAPTPEAPPAPAWTPEARAAAVAEGRAVLEKHECTRCHAIDDVAAPARPLGCTSCHIFLDGLEPDQELWHKIAEKNGEDVLVRYQQNIAHLKEVPDLSGLGRRVRPDWIADWLAAPTDLRPALEESMIRTALTAEERAALGRYFAAVAEVPPPHAAVPAPTPSAEAIAAGEALFQKKACGLCHTLGNRPTGFTREQLEANPTAKLAPNLRFTKERMERDTAVRWIVDPKSVWPAATMPPMGVSPAEAEAIADFLWGADPQLAPVPVADTDLPAVLDRPVAWAEVKEQVLGDVCVHCHMNDHEKDTGPGNGGGLGYAGLGLKMRTYESLVAGYRGRDALGGEVPVLVDRMLVRREEALRDHVPAFADHERPPFPEKLGMPMGIPARSDAQIALVLTWIRQGCPGPEEVTGKPGFDDGFLVPDGPIAKNHGCEVRAPAADRPPWAVR